MKLTGNLKHCSKNLVTFTEEILNGKSFIFCAMKFTNKVNLFRLQSFAGTVTTSLKFKAYMMNHGKYYNFSFTFSNHR